MVLVVRDKEEVHNQVVGHNQVVEYNQVVEHNLVEEGNPVEVGRANILVVADSPKGEILQAGLCFAMYTLTLMSYTVHMHTHTHTHMYRIGNIFRGVKFRESVKNKV